MKSIGRRIWRDDLIGFDRAPTVLRLAPQAAFAKSGATRMACRGNDVDEAQTRVRLDEIRTEHRDLDSAIAALTEQAMPDQLQVARLKKRKLRLRDEIAALQDRLIPDIIA